MTLCGKGGPFNWWLLWITCSLILILGCVNLMDISAHLVQRFPAKRWFQIVILIMSIIYLDSDWPGIWNACILTGSMSVFVKLLCSPFITVRHLMYFAYVACAVVSDCTGLKGVINIFCPLHMTVEKAFNISMPNTNPESYIRRAVQRFGKVLFTVRILIPGLQFWIIYQVLNAQYGDEFCLLFTIRCV